MLMIDDSVFSCSWDEFEKWIRKQIDGEFSWNIWPIDIKGNRQAIAESILKAIKDNNGSFPAKGDLFIEKLSDSK
jgi:hypothetical protein